MVEIFEITRICIQRKKKLKNLVQSTKLKRKSDYRYITYVSYVMCHHDQSNFFFTIFCFFFFNNNNNHSSLNVSVLKMFI